MRSWYINGRHYAQTCEDWLKHQDAHAVQGLAELERDAEAKGVGREEGRKTFYRCALFAFHALYSRAYLHCVT